MKYNKTKIKINKQPINIKKFDTNLSNNKIINKKDNNINIKKVRILYKNADKDNSIKLFYFDFIYENKNKCKIIYEGKESELKEYISIENIKNKEIEIILEIFDNITNAKSMFCGCE